MSGSATSQHKEYLKVFDLATREQLDTHQHQIRLSEDKIIKMTNYRLSEEKKNL